MASPSSSFNPRLLARKAHRWGAIGVALPFAVVIASGLLLQMKKNWSWVQPTEHRGVGTTPSIPYDRLLAIAQGVPEAAVTTWKDIDRVDIRPTKGILKITTTSRWEIQVDSETGEVLNSAYRRSDFLESVHDGSWFHPVAKLWLFFPSGIVVFVLWLTGLYLWLLPWQTRRARDRLATAGGPARRDDRPATRTSA
jgi:PepSY-associated TM region